MPKTWECSSRRCKVRSKPIIRLHPDEGPYPACPSVKSCDDASGKTGSGKKFYHSVTSGVDYAAQPYDVTIATPVIHHCMGGLEMRTRIQSQFQSFLPHSRKGCWRCVRRQHTGRQLSPGLCGLRPCGRSCLCQVRVQRHDADHVSCGACWWKFEGSHPVSTAIEADQSSFQSGLFSVLTASCESRGVFNCE